jgi:NADH dehydrogenase
MSAERGQIRDLPTRSRRPTVLVVGSGFAGFECARTLERKLPPEAADIVLVTPADHLAYLPLLPEVAAGVTDPRHIAVSLHRVLRRARVVLGNVMAVDLTGRQATVEHIDGTTDTLVWDRLALTPGAVTRQFPTPGLERFGRGFKTIIEAVSLRDHVLRQLAVAEVSLEQRAERLTFVVVGAGYAGTEFAAQMSLVTQQVIKRYPTLRRSDLRWLLVDAANRVLPELGEQLGDRALRTLRRSGIDVRLGTTVSEVTPTSVLLSDGERVPTRTLVWCAGVTPNPLIATLGLPTDRGRLRVHTDLSVPDHPEVFSFGDAASVPDLTTPGGVCPPTAQHAIRQGRAAAVNIAATLGVGASRSYRHRDLGLVVDLGGRRAVARPLGVPLSGIAAKTVTKGYHLYALPTIGNRLRVLVDWTLNLLTANQNVQLGLVPQEAGRLDGTPAAGPTRRSPAG